MAGGRPAWIFHVFALVSPNAGTVMLHVVLRLDFSLSEELITE